MPVALQQFFFLMLMLIFSFHDYSIKTTGGRSSGVFVAEMMPNSVAHNSGLEVSTTKALQYNSTVSVFHSYCTTKWFRPAFTDCAINHDSLAILTELQQRKA